MPTRSFSLSITPLDAHILHDAAPIAVVLFQPLVVHEPAERIEFAFDM